MVLKQLNAPPLTHNNFIFTVLTVKSTDQISTFKNFNTITLQKSKGGEIFTSAQALKDKLRTVNCAISNLAWLEIDKNTAHKLHYTCSGY